MFYEYIHNNPQWNLQINRQLEEIKENQKVKEDLKVAIPQLEKTKTWFQTWYDLGNMRERKEDFQLACAYFGLAQFYLSPDDQNKSAVVHKYLDNFYRSHSGINYKSYQVPY
ncbi:hypothetical protein ACUIJP_08320 [Leuconostoc pseudomesenteroides]|uniref:hypothetical protein n=1 Tax=Leuconostoc pseudomesenteroides TaxID=33968 RepID=UPI00403E0685